MKKKIAEWLCKLATKISGTMYVPYFQPIKVESYEIKPQIISSAYDVSAHEFTRIPEDKIRQYVHQDIVQKLAQELENSHFIDWEERITNYGTKRITGTLRVLPPQPRY